MVPGEPDPMLAVEESVAAVAAAVARHHISDVDVQEHVDRLAAMPWPNRSGYQTGQLRNALLDLSELHRAECVPVAGVPAACQTCEMLGQALAVLLAGLRCGLADDLRRRLR